MLYVALGVEHAPMVTHVAEGPKACTAAPLAASVVAAIAMLALERERS